TTTLYPASAHTCAMPEPMSPHPTTPTVFIQFRSVFVADHHRDALAAADAGGSQPVPSTAPAQLQRERQEQPRPRGAQRMSEGDGPAVDVGALPVEAQLLLHRQVLPGEVLVDLDEVHVLHREAGRLQ